VAKRAKTPNLKIVDVRTPEEFAAGHIEGAMLINWNDPKFEQLISALDKSQPTLVYCAVGGRSGKAYTKLKQMGFNQLFDMKGGFDAWKKDKLPIAY
jgi:rhodanese-related sulfurtransferase